MPLTNSQYDQIMRVYNERQLNSRRELDQRRDEVFSRIPRMAEIDAEVADLSVKKAFYILGDRKEGRNTDMNARLAEYAEERRALLLSHGYPEDYLEPKYHCPRCHDTGYVNGKKCQCFRQLEIQVLYRDSNLDMAIADEDFDHFSLDYYSTERRNPKNGRTEREEASYALKEARLFTEHFAERRLAGTPVNLCLYGDVGVGKTFLTHCIARELIRKGEGVLYLTAYDLFDLLGKYRFSRETDLKESHDAIFSCDLLIIDDLGTEMTNNFVTSELFLLINERILRKESTILSTNLSLESFRDSFSERTSSRIIGSYKLIHLSGRDIRIQKKLAGGN